MVEGSGKDGAFGLEVFDYSLSVNGDPALYESHEFTVRVWMGQHMYAIQRSYSAFCLFDAHLRRRYPRSKLPTLPLLGKDQFKQLLKSGGAGGKLALTPEDIKAAVFGIAPDGNLSSSTAIASSSSSSSSSAASTVSSSSFPFAGMGSAVTSSSSISAPSFGRDSGAVRRSSIRRIDNTEVIQQKKMPLTLYLQHLLTIPEILQSDMLLAFLDEESPDGELQDEDKLNATVSSIDLLVKDETPIQKRVLRQHVVSLFVEEGFVIVWKFSTKSHDIGFSVGFNETEVVTYQRVNSHIRPVTGLFEVPAKGQVKIIFDNTYSRMHTKNLCYCVRVVDAPECEAAKETAVYKAKEKATLLQQRSLLQKSLNELSHSLIASTGLNFSVKTNTPDSQARFRTMSTWEGELAQLRDEKKSLSRALEESIRALEIERNAFAESVGRIEEAATMKDAVDEELLQVRGEMDQIRQEAQEEREQHAWAIQELQASRDRALEAIDQARREMSEAKALKDQTEVIKTLESQLGAEKEETSKLAEQVSRLKAEKKVLKSSYLQSKAELERMVHERELQATETEKLREELRNALDAVASRERRQSSIERGEMDHTLASLALESKSGGAGLLSAYTQDLSERLSKIGESVFKPQTSGPVQQAPASSLFVEHSFGF